MGAKHRITGVAVATTEPRNPNDADQLIKAGLSKPRPVSSRQVLNSRQQRISPWWIVFGILLACGFLGAFKLSVPQAGLEDQMKPLLPPKRPASPSKSQATPLPSPSDSHYEQKGEDEKPQEKKDEKKKPQKPTPPTAPQKKWEAVSLHQLDEARKIVPDNVRGKRALCRAANRARDRAEAFEGKQRVILSTVALALTHEGSRDLVGTSLVVEAVKSFSADDPPGSYAVTLTIDKVVGFGTSSVYVSATTTQGKRFTLRIRVLDLEGSKYSKEECLGNVTNEKCGFGALASAQGAHNNLAVIRKKCGLLIPLYKGMVQGLYLENPRGSLVVLGEVDFMPALTGNLEQLLPLIAEEGDSAPYARSYIATRLLMQTLYLQQAGLSHNGLRWSNLFVDESGEVLLSGMDAAASFGEPLPKVSKLDALYGEPDLVKDFKKFMEGGSPVKANDKSDMWSLGALLYEVLTGRPFQSLVVNGDFDDTSRRTAAHELAHSGVHSAWRDLVLQLLELNREKRISAVDISHRLRNILSVTPY